MEINKILLCPQCNQRFDEPKILPCGNTICISCIRNFISSEKRAQNKYKCLICDELHKFGKDFPTNHLISKILEDELLSFARKYTLSIFLQKISQVQKIKI